MSHTDLRSQQLHMLSHEVFDHNWRYGARVSLYQAIEKTIYCTTKIIEYYQEPIMKTWIVPSPDTIGISDTMYRSVYMYSRLVTQPKIYGFESNPISIRY